MQALEAVHHFLRDRSTANGRQPPCLMLQRMTRRMRFAHIHMEWVFGAVKITWDGKTFQD